MGLSGVGGGVCGYVVPGILFFFCEVSAQRDVRIFDICFLLNYQVDYTHVCHNNIRYLVHVKMGCIVKLDDVISSEIIPLTLSDHSSIIVLSI